jgi:phosphoribosylaminoimidazolecarboxamide formyltransferase / IMP cyclohydrolase
MLGRMPDASAHGPAEGLPAPGPVAVRRALLSVSDKTGVVDFARGLADLGVELISTGGTAAALAEAGLAVRAIDDFTGFPEIMDGRVKTLHPRLYAGLLAVRDDAGHAAALEEHDIEVVDLVCVNLYPFEATVARDGVSDAEVIENIDIGGPTMVRAAAKNHRYSTIVTDPADYDVVLDELRTSDGALSFATRQRLAGAAYAATARYDAAISAWFAREEPFPPTFSRSYERTLELSYGENPHQRAAYYRETGDRPHLLSGVEQLHGKAISFNNLLDLDSCRALLRDLRGPSVAIVKHNNPCGAASADTALAAYERAFACDPVSAYGGIIAVNETVDVPLAERLNAQFVEVLIAPGYTDEALAILTGKKNIRILHDTEARPYDATALEIRQVHGGLLVEERDAVRPDDAGWTVATERQPTEQEWRDLRFAWVVGKHVKSNAIILARGDATIGIGAGQMSRVDSVRLSLEKAAAADLDVRGAALASDAFFPFADGPELAVRAGITAVVQPGGSIRDEEVVAAAEAAGVAMVFTHRRHFRH